MNHAQIDHLLQATATRPESLTSGSRARDAAPPFDNHFREASAANTSATQAPSKSTSSQSNSTSSSTPASPNSSTTNSESDDRTTKAPPAEASQTATSAEAAVSETEPEVSVEESPAESTSDVEENAEVAALLAAEQAAKASVKD